MRKLVLCLLGFVYLIGSGIVPPLMDLWNREGYLGPIPCFFAGLYLLAAALVLLTLFLFWWERNDDTFDM